MNKIITFFKEAWTELKQVSWLSVPQMIASTWIVIIMVVIVSIYILGVDKVFQSIISLLI